VKITDQPPISSWPGAKNNEPASQETGSSSFAETLAQRTAQAATSAETSTTPSLQQADSIGKIMASTLTSPLGEVERTFGLLEQYQEALADPTVTLKEVSTQVTDLEQASSRLLEIGQSLPETSPAHDLINRTAILAAVEAAKFRRGDYV